MANFKFRQIAVNYIVYLFKLYYILNSLKNDFKSAEQDLTRLKSLVKSLLPRINFLWPTFPKDFTPNKMQK